MYDRVEKPKQKNRAVANIEGTQKNYSDKSTSSSVLQLLNLAAVNRSTLPASGKKAFDLLDNGRTNFKGIDKSGGDVHAMQDGAKRVKSAWKFITDNKGGRNSSLQSTIGWLGNLEDEDLSAGYNGGHLIADSLGGSGSWQNMVPQDGPENKWGDWRQYEKENAKALSNTGSPLKVEVTLQYNSDSVVPDQWDSTMTDINGKDVNWYSASFF